ncbi:MAG: aminotransferase class III-fold pyridoxal phosphate-dependent enzyme [Saprospiraceae bacterium]|nr:aminotransferase class III-fold pyridoxal phosphate-dependent enzyme [Saprospiraceae bacterium]
MIFDEIINGFRLDQRGAQAWYGVDADICAYGKSISGGFPLAAVAGKSKYMNSFDGGYWGYGDDSSPEGVIAYFASTFIKNPISVAAAHAALSEIQRLGPGLQQDLNEKTARFAKRISEIFLRTKAPLMIQSASSFFMIKNADNSPMTRLFNYFLRARGINIRERPCFISTAHTEADFEKPTGLRVMPSTTCLRLGLMEEWEGKI